MTIQTYGTTKAIKIKAPILYPIFFEEYSLQDCEAPGLSPGDGPCPLPPPPPPEFSSPPGSLLGGGWPAAEDADDVLAPSCGYPL